MTTTQFNKCVETTADSLYRFILGIVGNVAQAEDIIQESYARLWESRGKVTGGKEKSYLFTIAYRLAISQIRARKKEISELPLTHFAEDNNYDNISELLLTELNKLNAIQRTVIMLSDWEGYSYSEIAQIATLTEAQVKITIYRARQTLREKLEHEYRP